MKTKIILMAFACILSMAACNQGKKAPVTEVAPKAVLDAFSSKFPKATNAIWEKESETEFEANFEMDGKKYSTKFDPAGKWLETESAIDSTGLPQSVKDSLAKNFAGFVMEDIELAETFDKGSVYEMKIEKGEASFSIVFSSNGAVVKKEAIKEKDDEKDEDNEKGEKDEKEEKSK